MITKYVTFSFFLSIAILSLCMENLPSDLITPKDLYKGVVGNDSTIIKKLFDKTIDIDMQDRYGKTALQIAAKKGNLEAVEVLIYNNANVNLRDYTQRSPLMFASLRGHTVIVKLLLAHKANRWIGNILGHNAKDLAKIKGHDKIVDLLRDYRPIELKECLICSRYILEDTIQLACGHDQFHIECIEQWKKIRSNCPLCRHNL